MRLFNHGVAAAAAEVAGGGLADPPLAIALVTENTTHGAATNTRSALVNAGHTVTLIDDATLSGAYDWSPYDVIVVVRATNGTTVAGHIRTAWDAGKPVVVTLMDQGTTATTGHSMIATHMDLCGTVQVWDTLANMNRVEIVDNTHDITNVFAVGNLSLHSTANWTANLDSGASYAGTLLAWGHQGSAADERVALFAIEVGDLDLAAVPAPARAVAWGQLYGGQSAYSTDGATLLDRIVRWAAGG